MKFDMHLHSSLSDDSKMSVSEIVKIAKERGLDGIAISDHNAFANHPAYNDFYIIPACELSTDAGHLLVYFLCEDICARLKKDESGLYHWRDVCNTAHDMGALVFLAHPFSPKKKHPDGLYDTIDGIEAYNARVAHSSIKSANSDAVFLAKSLKKPFSAGSDAHSPAEIGTAFFECDLPDTDIASSDFSEKLKSAIMSQSGKIFAGKAPAHRVFKSKFLIRLSRRQYKSAIKYFLAFMLMCIIVPFKKNESGKYITVDTEE